MKIPALFFPLLAFSIAPPQLHANLTRPQMQQASTLFCQALNEGKSPAEAKETVTEYLLDQVADPRQLNRTKIRKRMRPVVRQQCPDKVRSLQDL